MEIHSVFEDRKPIPKKYTGEGEDVSPPLTFKNVPKEAKSLVLIVDDPDAPAGTYDHWILWNISPTITILSEGAPELERSELPVQQGRNHFGRLDYGGPMPPPGKPHRYFFKLYALDAILDIPEGSTKPLVEKAMRGHIIEEAEIIGTYQR